MCINFQSPICFIRFFYIFFKTQVIMNSTFCIVKFCFKYVKHVLNNYKVELLELCNDLQILT